MRGKRWETYAIANAAFRIKCRLAQLIETKSAASLPVNAFRDTTLFAINDLHQTGDAMGNSMFTHLDSDVTPAHLLRDRSGCAGTKKRVEDKISGIGAYLNDAAHQPLWLWRQEYILTNHL